MASLLFAEAKAAHHKNNLTHIINEVHHNISHAQNVSFNITVNASVAKVIEAAHNISHIHHIEIHHNNTHANISVHVNLKVHVNHSKLGAAIHKARAEIAKHLNASVNASAAGVVLTA